MTQMFKPLSKMLDLIFFENSARKISPTYLCKHMTFFPCMGIWAMQYTNSLLNTTFGCGKKSW